MASKALSLEYATAGNYPVPDGSTGSGRGGNVAVLALGTFGTRASALATYFDRGFFNVPVEYQRHFGNDLERIDIYCGEERLHVAGYINRGTANRNGTPRIMGGVQLKRWMQKESKLMGEIDVLIQSPTSIFMTSRTTQ